jgi:hypothetical protein
VDLVIGVERAQLDARDHPDACSLSSLARSADSVDSVVIGER